MLRADARARAARQVWLHAWDAGRRAETRNGRPMTKKEQRLYRDVLWQDLRRLRRKSRFARRLAAAGARAVAARLRTASSSEDEDAGDEGAQGNGSKGVVGGGRAEGASAARAPRVWEEAGEEWSDAGVAPIAPS